MKRLSWTHTGGVQLDKVDQAIEYLEKIENEYPESEQATKSLSKLLCLHLVMNSSTNGHGWRF